MTDQKIEELKSAIREANAAIKDLRSVIREAQTAQSDLIKLTQKVVEETMEEKLNNQIEKLAKETIMEVKAALDRAVERTSNKFAEFEDTIMGRTKRDRRQGRPDLETMVHNFKDV